MRKRIKNYISQRTSFLAGISHDLGTLITRIKLQLELMKKNKEIDSIKSDVDTMQLFLKEYLDYSEKIKKDKDSNVNILKILNEVINSSAIIKKKTTLRCKKNLFLKTNKNNLLRILFNLIENASNFGDKIIISVINVKDILTINIDDNGPGIPSQFKKKIFKPFFKVDDSRNLNQKGSGLGLSIANELVKKINGEILIDNSKKLSGSCFTIKIRK